jgi:hypothetical protein
MARFLQILRTSGALKDFESTCYGAVKLFSKGIEFKITLCTDAAEPQDICSKLTHNLEVRSTGT